MTDASSLPYRPCVGVMLLNPQGLAFVGRRAERIGASEGSGNWWQMPQGGVDEGETLEVAAYDLPPELIGFAWKGRYRGQRQMWFAARFEGEESEIDLGPHPGHKAEFDAWAWVPAAELPDLVVPFKREVYIQVVAEFAPLLKIA
jgi:putative (di)nucleoside polyphosphate hydrolase